MVQGYSKLYTGVVGEDGSTLLTSAQQVKLAISIRSDNISKQSQIEYSKTAYENFTEALHFFATGSTEIAAMWTCGIVKSLQNMCFTAKFLA